MRKGRLSRKQAFLFMLLAISGLVAWLYLTSFAGILLLACRTGLVVIKADSLMPIESAIVFCACIVIAFITIYSVAAIASDLTNVKVLVDLRSLFHRRQDDSPVDTYT